MKSMMKTAAAVSVGALMAYACLAPAAGAEPELLSGTVHRVSSTEWAVIDDAAHTPTGIESVTLMADRVRVNYDFDASVVSSLQATPDESFTQSGVRVGASVGLGYTDLYFYMGTSTVPVNPGLLSKAGANVWLSGVFDLAVEGAN